VSLIRRGARELVSALYSCHVEAKVVHRDIKPDNIMISWNKSLVLVDFGISSTFKNDDDVINGGDRMTFTGYYMPPEVVKTQT
jgi:serine/threonine protein kinase